MKKLFLIAGVLLFTGAAFNGTANNRIENSLIVTNRDCINYLVSRGYSNVTVLQILQDGSRYCDTSYPYNTTVLVGGEQIIGSVDDGMN